MNKNSLFFKLSTRYASKNLSASQRLKLSDKKRLNRRSSNKKDSPEINNTAQTLKSQEKNPFLYTKNAHKIDSSTFTSSQIENKFWGPDFYDQEKKFASKSSRFVPQPVQKTDFNFSRKDYPNEKSVHPSLSMYSNGFMEFLYSLHTKKPEVWTVHKLSTNFAVSIFKVRRILQVEELKKKMRKEFDEEKTRLIMADDPRKEAKRNKFCKATRHSSEFMFSNNLEARLKEIFGVNRVLNASLCLLNEVFNTRTGKFLDSPKLRQFGCTDEDMLKRDLGEKVPVLLERKIPKEGPGSGAIIKDAPVTTKMKNSLAIIDITNKKRFSQKEMDLPFKIRERNGQLRETSLLEYKKMKKRELGPRTRKFSPH